VQQLWGHPASHFGVGDDALYVALVRFRRTLPRARSQVRELTHTSHLPLAHPELYESPPSEWLRDLLEQLPRLQVLIVQGLPFFDHASLLTLRLTKKSANLVFGNAALFNLRYLDASHCANATPGGLFEALKHFPALLYLDLSGVQAVRVPDVLRAISGLPNLQILKLRGLSLTDEDVEILARLGKKLRSLDLTDNNLTDRSVRTLVTCCLRRGRAQAVSSSFQYVQASHPSQSQLDDLDDFLEQYHGQHLDKRVRSKLTSGLVDSLAIELEVDPDITHLYLAGNNLTVEGSASVLRSGRMQVLDVGNMSVPPLAQILPSELLSVSKLIPWVNDGAYSVLSYLRADYTIATLDYRPLTDLSTGAELSGEAIAGRVHPLGHIYEADGQSIDQPTDEPQIIAGLEGSPVSSRVGFRQPEALERRGSWEASEAIASLAPGLILASPEFSVASASASAALNTAPNQNVPDPFSASLSGADSSPSSSPPISLIPPPCLKTLHLTSIPLTVPNKVEIDKLIDLIYICADAAYQASLRASESYALPPGTSRQGAASARRHYAKSLFALEKIVLEMAPPPEVRKHGPAGEEEVDSMQWKMLMCMQCVSRQSRTFRSSTGKKSVDCRKMRYCFL